MLLGHARQPVAKIANHATEKVLKA